MSQQKQVLSGFHSVLARMRQSPETIHEIYYDIARQNQRMNQLVDQARGLGLRLIPVNSARLDGFSKGDRHQGVVAFADQKKAVNDLEELLGTIDEVPHLLILDGVTDPHNLGACLRTADATGVHAVIAPKDRCVGINTTVARVSCGASETVPYVMVTNLARTMRMLKARGIFLIGTTDQSTEDIYDVKADMPIAWVMGSEGDGLRRLTKETCDLLVRIPMLGSVESLNVSVASAVCMYETLRQRTK
ncbi:MAG: 23S rRNA (guanosine(2251)-2'-O)-methyltransferase RlmB [Alcaligenaceae bacterium]|nr:23S rRNA (guanosine(2251)-2'-O)-methyltransferase RlmB [Alcaligenaceae bacterium]